MEHGNKNNAFESALYNIFFCSVLPKYYAPIEFQF